MKDFVETNKYNMIIAGHVSLFVYGTYYFSHKLSEQLMKKTNLKLAKYHNPQELHRQALSTESFFKRDPKNPLMLIAKDAVIEGVVDSKSPLKSNFSEKQLIYSELRRVPIYSNNYLFMGADGKNKFKRGKGHVLSQHETNFELYSLYDQQKQAPCLINRDLFSIPPTSLEEIGSRTTKLQDLSFFENIMVFFGLIIESIFFWYLPSNMLSGIFIGYSDKEFGVRAGGIMSLLGDLAYNIETKTLVLRKAQPIEMVLNFWDKKMLHTKLLYGAFVGVWAGVAFWLHKKRMQNKTKVRNNLKNQGNLVNIETVMKSEEANLCIICCEKPRSVLPKPCLHLSCCKKCFDSLKKKECPICRDRFEGYNEIFIEKKNSNIQ